MSKLSELSPALTDSTVSGHTQSWQPRESSVPQKPLPFTAQGVKNLGQKGMPPSVSLSFNSSWISVLTTTCPPLRSRMRGDLGTARSMGFPAHTARLTLDTALMAQLPE